MNWYLAALKNYANFRGRARRKEYWFFLLINFVISCVLTAIDFFTGNFNTTFNVGLLGCIYGLAIFVPNLAVAVRRLHDTGRSGWWLLIALVPCIGALVLLYFVVSPGTPGDNKYGADPRTAAPSGAVA